LEVNLVMAELVTVALSEELARRARALASVTHRRVEDAIVDWIGQAVAAPDVKSLDDEGVLALCDATMSESDQEELSALLAGHREGSLRADAASRLDDLLEAYRRGLVLKAKAIREAVSRGLRPRLDDHAA